MKRIGILTSGGDAPGMNAAIRAAVRTAVGRGASVAGYLDGYSGFVAGDFLELDDRAVGNIIQRGGTVIGTSRCPEFMEAGVRRAAAERMRADGVEGLIVVGGGCRIPRAYARHDRGGGSVAGLGSSQCR